MKALSSANSLFLILFCFLKIFIPNKIIAENIDVVINEIAWMGTLSSSNDEWIELYNNSTQDVNLSGWFLQINNKKIALKGIIKSHDFFLLERTDDHSVEKITADQIYTGGLNNNGSKIELIKNENSIDIVDFSNQWFFGNNVEKQTMERIDPLLKGNGKNNWQTSKDPEGTPKKKNSEGKIIEKSKTQSALIQKISSKKNLPKKSINWILPLTVSLFFSSIILVLKQNLKK